MVGLLGAKRRIQRWRWGTPRDGPAAAISSEVPLQSCYPGGMLPEHSVESFTFYLDDWVAFWGKVEKLRPW